MLCTGRLRCLIVFLLIGAPDGAISQEQRYEVVPRELAANSGGLRLLAIERQNQGGSLSGTNQNVMYLLVQPKTAENGGRVVRMAFPITIPMAEPFPIWTGDVDVDPDRKTAFVAVMESTWAETVTRIFRVDLANDLGPADFDFSNPDKKDRWPAQQQPLLVLTDKGLHTIEGGKKQRRPVPYDLKIMLTGRSLLIAYFMYKEYWVFREVDLETLRARNVLIENKVPKGPPAVPGTVSWNEECSATVMRQIASIEKEWPSRYAVFGSGYWVADVYGMYGIGTPDVPYALVPKDLARADRFPLPASTKRGTTEDPLYVEPPPATSISYNGYHFESLVNDETGNPYHVDPKKNENHNRSKFGFRALPADYGKTGTRTFQVNEKGIVYAKDLGLGAEKNPPRGSWEGGAEPEKAGWAVVD